jgi:hypothetical protein
MDVVLRELDAVPPHQQNKLYWGYFDGRVRAWLHFADVGRWFLARGLEGLCVCVPGHQCAAMKAQTIWTLRPYHTPPWGNYLTPSGCGHVHPCTLLCGSVLQAEVECRAFPY